VRDFCEAHRLFLSLLVFLAVMRALPRLLAPVARVFAHTHTHIYTHGIRLPARYQCGIPQMQIARHDYRDGMRLLNTNSGTRERI